MSGRVEIEQAIRAAHAAGWSRADVERLIASQPVSLVDGLLLRATVLELFGYEQPAPTSPQGIPDEGWVDDVFLDDLDVEDSSGLDGATKTATAEGLLEAILADGDWHASAEVRRLLAAGGFPARTAQRAAKDIGVEAVRRGYPSRTYWRLSVATSATEPVGATDVGASVGASADAAQPNGFGESVVAPVNERGRARRLPGIGILLRRTTRARA